MLERVRRVYAPWLQGMDQLLVPGSAKQRPPYLPTATHPISKSRGGEAAQHSHQSTAAGSSAAEHKSPPQRAASTGLGPQIQPLLTPFSSCAAAGAGRAREAQRSAASAGACPAEDGNQPRGHSAATAQRSQQHQLATALNRNSCGETRQHCEGCANQPRGDSAGSRAARPHAATHESQLPRTGAQRSAVSI